MKLLPYFVLTSKWTLGQEFKYRYFVLEMIPGSKRKISSGKGRKPARVG